MEVDWPFFGELCRALALRVAAEYQPEVVLGVAKAGVIPGVVVASSEVRALAPLEVRTAVSFKTGDYAPDYHAFETESFIILPWDREVILGGELVMRPDYAARLG
jgi:hypoxanthine phosphoribosyltransferase